MIFELVCLGPGPFLMKSRSHFSSIRRIEWFNWMSSRREMITHLVISHFLQYFVFAQAFSRREVYHKESCFQHKHAPGFWAHATCENSQCSSVLGSEMSHLIISCFSFLELNQIGEKMCGPAVHGKVLQISAWQNSNTQQQFTHEQEDSCWFYPLKTHCNH